MKRSKCGSTKKVIFLISTKKHEACKRKKEEEVTFFSFYSRDSRSDLFNDEDKAQSMYIGVFDITSQPNDSMLITDIHAHPLIHQTSVRRRSARRSIPTNLGCPHL
jgi:hypothetical protein